MQVSSAQAEPVQTAATMCEQLEHMSSRITELLRTNLLWSQEVQREHANRHRQDGVSVQVGERVWLDAANIRTTRPHKKLDYRRIGPFEVLRAIGRRSYLLSLPKTLLIHPVFHVSLLEKAASDPLPGQLQPVPLPLELLRDGEPSTEWEVKGILDAWQCRKQLSYLVLWKGGERTKEPWKNVIPGSETLVKAFHQAYPAKPKPPRTEVTRFLYENGDRF